MTASSSTHATPHLLLPVYALQHIMAAFNGIIAVPLVVCTGLGLDTSVATYCVSCALFAAGLATLLQSAGIGPVGARMPCIMGTSFTFVGPALSVGRAFGLAEVFVVTAVGSVTEIVYSRFIPFLRRIFPRLVSGIVVSLIGLTLIPVAIDWMAGGRGAPNYGSGENLLLAGIVIVAVLVFHSIRRWQLTTFSIFLGMCVGYAIAALRGDVSAQGISALAWFSFPEPFRFGFSFHWQSLLPFAVAYLITTIETIGDLTAIAEAQDRDISAAELERGILADGVGSTVGGIFNAGANTTFSQNVGIVSLTGVTSRHVTILAGIFLIVMGLFPRLSHLIAIMPLPVLGGAGLCMFGMVAAAGMKQLHRETFTRRSMVIVALSFGVGLGVEMRHEIVEGLPEALKLLFGSGITAGALTAIALNAALPAADADERAQ